LEFFGSLFRWVKPVIWSGAKAFGRETLRTGGKIVSDIAENKSPELSTGDTITRHVTDSTRTLISKLGGRGRKRARGPIQIQAKNYVKCQNSKEGYFLLNYISRSPPMSTGTLSVSSEFDIFAHKPIQTSVLETIETVYKTIFPV